MIELLSSNKRAIRLWGLSDNKPMRSHLKANDSGICRDRILVIRHNEAEVVKDEILQIDFFLFIFLQKDHQYKHTNYASLSNLRNKQIGVMHSQKMESTHYITQGQRLTNGKSPVIDLDSAFRVDHCHWQVIKDPA